MVRALVSFSGAVTMHKGQTGEIEDVTILNDLLAAGYVEVMESEVVGSDGGNRKRVSKG